MSNPTSHDPRVHLDAHRNLTGASMISPLNTIPDDMGLQFSASRALQFVHDTSHPNQVSIQDPSGNLMRIPGLGAASSFGVVGSYAGVKATNNVEVPVASLRMSPSINMDRVGDYHQPSLFQHIEGNVLEKVSLRHTPRLHHNQIPAMSCGPKSQHLPTLSHETTVLSAMSLQIQAVR